MLCIDFIAIFSFMFSVAMNAQSDGFFRNSFNYNNRTAEIDDNDGTGINNYGIGETVPLGGGLVVLLAAGAGYAVARRRRSSKKLISLLLACLTDASNGEGKCLYGLIIFPDTYIHPSSDLAPLPPKINDPNSAFTDNNYTIAQWTEMEKAKAVFLPAAGCRWTNPDASIIAYKIQDINNHCYYWSSSDDISHPSTHAKNMRIGTGDFVSNSYTQRVRGNCVRLVRIATSAE